MKQNMKHVFCKVFLIALLSFLQLCGKLDAAVCTQLDNCHPQVSDYSYIWWAYGWPLRVKDADSVLCFQTGHYGFAIDVTSVKIKNFGCFKKVKSAEQVLTSDNKDVFNLPVAELDLQIHQGDKIYSCTGAKGSQEKVFTGSLQTQSRMINVGCYVQRADIVGLEFMSADGEKFNGCGRLEIIVWPDTLSLLLEVEPNTTDSPIPEPQIQLNTKQGYSQLLQQQSYQRLSKTFYNNTLIWKPQKSDFDKKNSDIKVTAADAATNKPLTCAFDASRQWIDIALPEKEINSNDGKNHLEEYRLTLTNPYKHPVTTRLFFHADYLGKMTGLVPVLVDDQNLPSGIQIQLCKNWHKELRDGTLIDPILYQGYWFHGFTLLHLPAGTSVECRLKLICSLWGNVPAASHSQLCLVGWGLNQLWDQAAIGNWGESICYDPDVNLNRSMIDDVRPLMVTSLSKTNPKWEWTNNIGGGDFLVYVDEKQQLQPLVRMKTYYQSHGPNLTYVTYAGTTADGKIDAKLTVSTPRGNDINRAYHRIRYDVRKVTDFKRLAFYQLGADNYNDHQFNKIAYGNIDGLAEEWDVQKGGNIYHRREIVCKGIAPWFSLHDAINKNAVGATANRGLIIRQWKARLGGRDITEPIASVFGTENNVPSAALELSPPPNINQLVPGDFVDAVVELVIVPQFAKDYYGPNEGLKKSLANGENTFKPVYRLAAGNNLDVEAQEGKIVNQVPLTVAVSKKQTAKVKIKGGVSYQPITFTGLNDYRGYKLWSVTDKGKTEIDQSERGNDFWQTDYDEASKTFSITYNIPLCGWEAEPKETVFLFAKELNK